jgi:hypothetical protein
MGCVNGLLLAVASRSGIPPNLPPLAGVTATMRDDKRLLRQLKRDIKRAGNRKRRRYLKDMTAEADDFSFGRKRSDVMNQRPSKESRQAE